MSSTEHHPTVSVIIPVYNDYERLAFTLEALRGQSYPLERIEVLVVDNGSSPENWRDVAADVPLKIRHLRQPAHGSYAARNEGIAHATGEVVAFTDADCRPAEDWLERGVERLASEEDIGLLAGHIEVFPEDPTRPTLVEIERMHYAFPQHRYARRKHFGATANVVTRREVLEEVGPFAEELMSSGDKEWGRRVHRAGWRVVYAPEVVVRHPARSTFEAVIKKAIRVAKGGHQVQRNEQARGDLEEGRAAEVFLRNARRFPGRVLGALSHVLGDSSLTPREKVAIVVTRSIRWLVYMGTRWALRIREVG